MRTMCSPPAVSAPNASVSATNPSSNDTSERSTTCFTAATDAGGIDAMRDGQLADDRRRARHAGARASSQPMRTRLLGADVATREDHLQRAAAAEQVRQAGGARRRRGGSPSPPRAGRARRARSRSGGRGRRGTRRHHRAPRRRRSRSTPGGLRCRRSNSAAATLGSIAGSCVAGRDGEDAVHVAVHEEEVGIGAREHDDARARRRASSWSSSATSAPMNGPSTRLRRRVVDDHLGDARRHLAAQQTVGHGRRSTPWAAARAARAARLRPSTDGTTRSWRRRTRPR